MQWHRRYVEVNPHPLIAAGGLALAVAGGSALLLGLGWGGWLTLLAGLIWLLALRLGRRVTLSCSMQGLVVQVSGQPERRYNWAAVGHLTVGEERSSLGLTFIDGFQLSLGPRTGRLGELVEFVTAMTPHLRERLSAEWPIRPAGRFYSAPIRQGKEKWYA